MKTLILLIISFFAINKIQAQDNFLGCWANKDKTQIVRIYKVKSKYFGKVLYLENSSKYDAKIEIIVNKMKRLNKNVLVGGTYYDYNSNQTFNVTITIKQADTIELILDNSSSKSNLTWTRIIK